MGYTSEEIGLKLKQARLEKKWSQTKLSKSVGIAQSHISKIESGAIDLQTSSLVQLARALDLELMLVPRIMTPAVRALIFGTNQDKAEQIPMYQLDEEQNE